jgi:hypothetical protein
MGRRARRKIAFNASRFTFLRILKRKVKRKDMNTRLRASRASVIHAQMIKSGLRAV